MNARHPSRRSCRCSVCSSVSLGLRRRSTTTLAHSKEQWAGGELSDRCRRTKRVQAFEALGRGGDIDSNYFYAQYLCDRNECHDALRYLQRAVAPVCPARLGPGRQVADEGRHREVLELMAKAR